jgi:hypothetical protein
MLKQVKIYIRKGSSIFFERSRRMRLTEERHREAVLRIWIRSRIRMFLGLLDPDPDPVH